MSSQQYAANERVANVVRVVAVGVDLVMQFAEASFFVIPNIFSRIHVALGSIFGKVDAPPEYTVMGNARVQTFEKDAM